MRLLIIARAVFILLAISMITFCASLKVLKADFSDVPSAEATEYTVDGMISDTADADTGLDIDTLPRSSFGEVWGYLLSGREADLDPAGPVSDAVHFAAEVDRYGRLADIPRRSAITGFGGRVHLAVVCGSGGLSHFVIQTGSAARKRLVADIIAAAGPYDGLNIDMEYIPALDGEHFLSFLAELRAGLEGKPLSVCVPARTRDGTAGPYSYAPIAALAERVFVMAYDEHWSGSSPGPVASMEWCEEVAAYSLRTVGAGKLVMGLPFYGRGWADKSTAQALVRGTAERLREEHDASDLPRASGVPGFTYDVTVRVTVYYEDERSLASRMAMYSAQGVRMIGFWRLGQEAPDIWRLITLGE